MKRVMQIILIAIVLSISGYLLISNIQHMIYLYTKTYTYDFENGPSISSIRTSMEGIEKNVAEIAKMQNSYLSDEDLNMIKKSIKESYNRIKELKFWDYTTAKNKTMKSKGLITFLEEINPHIILSNIDIYRILSEYNSNLNIENYIKQTFLIMVAEDCVYEELINNYEYRNYSINYTVGNIKTVSAMHIFDMKISDFEKLTALVLESGEFNE